jgi:hypothetical protein
MISGLAHPSPVRVTNVYALTDHNLKENFLDELVLIAPRNFAPWIILGDFNLLWYPFDKNNSFREAEADMFND